MQSAALHLTLNKVLGQTWNHLVNMFLIHATQTGLGWQYWQISVEWQHHCHFRRCSKSYILFKLHSNASEENQSRKSAATHLEKVLLLGPNYTQTALACVLFPEFIFHALNCWSALEFWNRSFQFISREPLLSCNTMAVLKYPREHS